jgi:transposase
MSEAAKRLNKSRQVISLWIKEARRKSESNPFPQPEMRLTDKSPLWKWREIVEWLYFHNLIKEKELVDRAFFIENLNAVLEARDNHVKKIREGLLGKLAI